MRHALGIAILGLVASVAAIAGQSWHAKNPDYQQGIHYLELSQWPEAISAFTRAASLHDGSADGALYWKAYAQHRSGNDAAAHRTLSEFERLYSGSTWAQDVILLESQLPIAPSSFHVAQADRPSLLVLAAQPQPQAQVTAFDLARNAQNPAVRHQAIEYLGLLGGYGELEKLYSGSTAPAAKQEVVRALVLRGQPQTLVHLAVQDPVPAQRIQLLNALTSLPLTPVLNDLKQWYPHEHNPQVVNALLNTLVLHGERDTLQALVETEPDRQRKAQLQNSLLYLNRQPH